MRRSLALLLLIVVCSQSSGAALAATRYDTSTPSIWSDVSNALHRVAATSFIAALLTGQADRWNAMHAPPPHFPKAPPPPMVPVPEQIRTTVRIHPTVRGEGIYLHPAITRSASAPTRSTTQPALTPAASQAHSAPRQAQSSKSTVMSPRPQVNLSPLSVNLATPATTGIVPWWSYQEAAMPGVGRYMVNVANGNLVVQASDVDIPERGIDLAFSRTYNSTSKHDYSGSDGSIPSNFGNGWTATFDAHIAANSAGGISVYDVDGARYDYTVNSSGGYSPPAGEHALLFWDPNNGVCWEKTTGTEYCFFSENESGSLAAYAGRLNVIYARNHNNNIKFAYAWINGDASSSANLSQIKATHKDGHVLTLSFGSVNGYDELATVTRPDGQQVNYYYDNSGDLTSVYEPPNGSNNNQTRPQGYGYVTGTYQLEYASDPRWITSSGNDGSYTYFNYNSNKVSSVLLQGWLNFTPPDGTGSLLQTPMPSGSTAQANYETFTYNSAETTVSDSNGHSNQQTFDSLGRVTQQQAWNGSIWLTTTATWDVNNNQTETTDPRGDATDYGFDGNGNTIWVQNPQVTTSLGAGRPLARYSYDQYNNLIAACDPQYIWTTGATTCNSGAGVTYYTWNYSDSNEAYGYLTDVHTAVGYHWAIGYNNTAEGGGDYGLPTDITGDPISQSIDPNTPSRTPHETSVYDAYGNVLCDSTLQNGSSPYWSRTIYDSLNRATAVADADDVSLTVSQCSNPGIANSHIQATTTYYPDNQMASTQTPSEYAAGISTTYSYDSDGDEAAETHHYGGVAGTMNMWYDGIDRLVEVQLPHDPGSFTIGTTTYTHDYYTYPWRTRYLYDLTQGGGNSVLGSTVSAHGGLFEEQEYTGASATTGSWLATKGFAYDALDRQTTKLQPIPCPAPSSGGSGPITCSNAVATTSDTYDVASGTAPQAYGFLTSVTGPVNGQQTSPSQEFAWDSDGQLASVTYYSTTFATYTYDPDGRPATVASQLGSRVLQYDADGQLTTEKEPASSSVTSPAKYTYQYDGSGMRTSLGVSNETTGSAIFSMAYAYRQDGLPEYQQFTMGSTTQSFTTTYTPAGRILTDVGPGSATAGAYSYNSSGLIASETGYNVTATTSGPSSQTVTRSISAYDPEGERLSGTDQVQTGSTTNTTNWNAVYNVRGEIIANPVSDLYGVYTGYSQSANGFLNNLNTAQPQIQWDALEKVPLTNGLTNTLTSAITHYNYAAQGLGSYGYSTIQLWNGACTVGSSSNTGNSYDGAGHIMQTSVSTKQYPSPRLGQCPSPDNPTSYSYSANYTWDANEHPMLASAAYANSTETLHWDGDTLLFTSSAASGIDDVKLNEFAEHISSGDNVYPRDLSDFSGDNLGQPQAANSQNYQSTYVQNFAEPRTDGISDGINTFQGVRSYNANVGAWTTPDATDGNATDPMSEQSYIWNASNPLMYQDPTGYYVNGPQPPTPCDGQDASCGTGNPFDNCSAEGQCWVGYDAAEAAYWPGPPLRMSPLIVSVGQAISNWWTWRNTACASAIGRLCVQMGFAPFPGSVGKIFDAAGVEIIGYARMRLLQRLLQGRIVSPRAVLDAYNRGRIFYDPKYGNYQRWKGGVGVVTNTITGGKILNVLPENPSPRLVPVTWRP
jgi:YD repeat-containing protein